MYPNPSFIPHPVEDAAKLNMKRLTRSESTRWALVTVIANLIISVVLLVFSSFVENLPYETAHAINYGSGAMLQQIAYSLLLFTIPYLIMAKATKQPLSSLVTYKWKKPKLSVPFIMIALGAAMIINVLTSTFINLVESFGFNTAMPELEMPQDPVGATLFVVALTVVPAVVEEFAFRGVIMGSMKKYGSGFAIVASSVLFGLMHGNIVQIPFATALGLVLGYVTVLTGSIVPAMIIHFLNNFVSAVQSLLDTYCAPWAGELSTGLFFIIYLIAGVVGLIMICKRYKKPFSAIREKSALTIGESVKAALSSGGFITSYIYFGGTACLIILINGMNTL